MPDASQTDTRTALIEIVVRWANTLQEGKAVITVAEPPRPEWDVKVTPVNPRAAAVMLRTDAPGQFSIYVGENTWWDRIPFSEEAVRAVISSIVDGGFTEWRRTVAGRIVASRGELMVGESRWTDRGSVPVIGMIPGDEQEHHYEPY